MSNSFSRKAGRRIDATAAQLDFWPALRTRSMVALARLHAPMPLHHTEVVTTQQVRSGACPQRSEDSRRGTPQVTCSAIKFGGYCGACTACVPVGNTGTTSTGQGV
jgi:hypothetical protein